MTGADRLDATEAQAIYNRAPELRSIAASIEPLFPDAADLLRGIAQELES